MSIYGGKYQNTSDSALFESVEPIEFQYSNYHEGAMALVAETEYNFGMLMKAIGVEELSHFEETHQMMVYTESTGSGFFARVKEFLMGLWAKVKGMFNHFIAMIDSFTKNEKEFARKYKKDLYKIGHSMKDFKFKGYNFTFKPDFTSAVTSASSATGLAKLSNWSEILNDPMNNIGNCKKIRENWDETSEVIRGAILKCMGDSNTGACTASEYSKALFEVFRDGESEKQELENIDISNVIATLETAGEARRTAEKAFRDIEKILKYNINAVEKGQNEVVKKLPKGKDDEDFKSGVKNSDVMTIAQVYVQANNFLLQSLITANGALLTALKDEGRQAKAICVAMMHYKPKNEGVEDYTNEGGFLSNLRFQ